MKTEPCSEIDDLLRLTEEMFNFASEGAWDQVEAYEAQRITAINSLASAGNETDATVVAKVRQILDRNAEIVVLAITEKNNIAEELKLSKRFEKAEKAYRDIDVE